jgi:serine phosphatase RsbU (regulator of sigma subunit)
LIDVEAHSMTMASAGHIAPLLIDGDQSRYVKFHVNVPIGVMRDFDYQETTVSVPPNSTLVAFTDGLVERRTEILDAGLARLQKTATGRELAPDDLVETLTRDLASKDHNDDTAIVVIQWES